MFDQCLIQYNLKNLYLADKLYPKLTREMLVRENLKYHIHDGLRLYTHFLKKEKSIYQGEVNVNSIPNGIGSLIYEDGKKYEGRFVNGVFTGYGRYIDKEGNSFEGLFENYSILSPGIKRTLNSSVYEGDFSYFTNLKDGKGQETTKEYEYKGEFKSDKQHGKGKISFNNGESYEGEFNEDLITGFGKYTWKNKHTYEGTLNNCRMHGKGLYKWPDGSEYNGDYTFNVKVGNGVFKWPNGRMYNGQFSDGKPHGKGILIDKGCTYEVEFDKGTMTKTIKKNNKSFVSTQD